MPPAPTTPHAYGRVAVAEPPSTLLSLHLHTGRVLRSVDHEPKIAVLDQENLIEQGIRCSTFIPGCHTDPDALGSCVYNTLTEALSNTLDSASFRAATRARSYKDTAAAERFAIRCYHAGTDQTGDPATEWPPTDCGSSGLYAAQYATRQGWAAGATVAAHDAESIVSLVQTGGAMVGSPFFMAWEQPGPDGFVDDDGSPEALQKAIASGVAGGHETYLSAVEKLTVTETGRVVAEQTVLRHRNHWTPSWGDAGSYRIHLSTWLMLGRYVDIRRLEPPAETGGSE